MSILKKEQLISELTSYINNGYLMLDSFDDPRDEAATALCELRSIDSSACEFFCKKILLSVDVGDPYLDGFCLGRLFDLNKEYALDYVTSHVMEMSAPVLGAAMDGLAQYSKTSFRLNFTEDLVAKIYARYDDVAKNHFSQEVMASSYRLFVISFTRKSD
ncbi:UNVERIFIED_ORG: hypothetical protein J2806_000067 [Kosakonia oryzae]|uniref:Uncharacterized protein n=1 Tax=Kosakonia radicincitans TaxID=283686 RepID=A0AAX2EZM6_9ENTR|nr:hypothetical protein [Kosakonia radicincitans]MDP9564434.1 hypothetical protein [Kosakonia oryzae]KDE37454.1 hypothetical protein AW40_06580 [Kosakonia radicincitans UMEnt01/12]SFF40572.1 hypothetical protein SAMN03159468_05073 [Kosakonia radicincitans]SFR26768.1 hypothetical protein SAMN03159514_05082 [Kosakonia radicincitans]SFU17464.1 hypothetical protein SAMN03159428_05035 [Kosakonia radicincitans]